MEPQTDSHPSPPSGWSIAFDPAASPASRQVERMVAAWRRGERPPAEDFLAGQPGLDDEAAIRLIFEEFCLRQEAGTGGRSRRISPAGSPGCGPSWNCCSTASSSWGRAPTDLPVEGEELAGFRLLAELGRGALGRVFLASQLALADRPVVVKVTPLGRDEHLSLARLQHMNIVPLYSVQVLHDRRLQVLCMPYLGGASLAQVLGSAGGRGTVAEDRCSARRGPRSGPGGSAGHAVRQGSVPEFPGPVVATSRRSAWVGVCLADGLQYAHERNFVHMDIKPSNVLLAGDGQPMLLDFHLAREPIAQGDPAPDHLGGTPGSMAPEQLEAMAAVREGRPVRAALDGRADLFALGLILDEALGGIDRAATAGPREPLHRRNPRVSVGLSDIVQKCLQGRSSRPLPRRRRAGRRPPPLPRRPSRCEASPTGARSSGGGTGGADGPKGWPASCCSWPAASRRPRRRPCSWRAIPGGSARSRRPSPTRGRTLPAGNIPRRRRP